MRVVARRKSRNLRIRRRSRDLMSYALVVFGNGVVSAHLQRLIFTWVLFLSVGLKATLVFRAVLVGMSLVARGASAASA